MSKIKVPRAKSKPAASAVSAKRSASSALAKKPAQKLVDTLLVSSEAAERANSAFPIVGVGASAGGLEAFTQLLEELPRDTGMAFVLIQHLDATHASFLADALAKTSKMPIHQAVDGERVEPNHVYVIPPNADLAILHGALTLLPRSSQGRRPHLPIDFFLRSLAAERGNRAIGVILSGTASDGTEGLRAIKGEDGITFVQEPRSAKFEGMPRSAIDAGVVDYSLQIHELAQELVRLSRHPYVSASQPPLRRDEVTLNKIFVLVRSAVGVDFSEYKTPTFERRLARRMALRKVDVLTDYLALLQDEPNEVRDLYEDILIHVTSFFRDPEVFESLKTQVFPSLLSAKADGASLRFWVAGCSLGEEVYSLAIALLEFLGNAASTRPIQIFGSDVSEKAIERARSGVYPDAALRDMSDERRRRYFTKLDTGFRINKTVRDLCVFVRHDLARDPPFSKLDLVSCRNVLIYFGPALQKRVLPTFHYALNQGGILMLGRTESISGFAQLFEPLDKAHKFFVRSASASALRFAPRSEQHPVAAHVISRGINVEPRRTLDLAKQLDRVLLAHYAPPGVLINERMEVLRFSGETGAYLQQAAGEPQNNLLKMARADLALALRGAVGQAKKSMAPVRISRVALQQSGAARSCDLLVLPFTGAPDAKEQLFVVLFEQPSATARSQPKKKTKGAGAPAEARRIPKLEHELATTKEYLQSLLDEQDRTNDDLNSANEELMSGNEELQSMNEELETAKEELQSTNEELSTVNDELHSRNHEVSEVNSDLVNILATVDLPILILDRARRIRRFTPKACSILNVLPSDVGRPLDDIRSNLELGDLDRRIADVVESNRMHEAEVQDRAGVWYRMQIRPYKNVDNKIDGATLSLVDIDALKHLVSEAQQAKAEAERANRSKDEFLATLSHEIRTPLSSMLMQAQLLRLGDRDAAQVQRAAEGIERGTRLQVQLIDDLLDVSRITAGKLNIELKRVDLCAVVRAALESVNAPVQKKAIQLTMVLDERIQMVTGDPTRLQQIVTNLLANAIKFTPKAGQIRVELDRIDSWARLTVQDNGIGIEPDFLPSIFNRFAQEDGSIVRRHGGLGLGLAIVTSLVAAHGGTVRAESPGKGKGATFTVTLPLAPVSDEDAREASLPMLHASLRRSASEAARAIVRLDDVRILLVDDDLWTREAVSETLCSTGANVRVAESAAEAMRAVEEFRPEVLVCDVAMPDEDGYSLIRRIRALGAARSGNVPALALTALAGDEDRARALAAGFQLHLSKPVELDRLTQAVADLSRRHLATA
jgi:two-component system, chemotaxis family, CheB/CheR fusion protein